MPITSTRRRVFAAGLLPGLLLVLSGASGCGGGYDGNGSPTAPSGGSPGPSGATITIANGALSSAEVTISVGQSVTFLNNDGRAREISSDPHPTHTECPAINALGTLQPSQARLTHAFATPRTCGFHDHLDPDNAAVRGRIVIR